VYENTYHLKRHNCRFFDIFVPDTRVGLCLEPEGNGVSSGEGGEGGPGPPNKKGEDKQSTPSEEGGNMQQEEEGKKSQQHREEEPACTE
jgi:hypothetical protein